MIEFTEKPLHYHDEYRRQAGYLLLDVGVETLLKSYLMRPDIKTKMGFKQREEAAKGTIEKDNIPDKKITSSVFDEQSFHNLTLAVKQAAGDTVEKEALEKAEFFHAIRNKIYHSGTGVVPAKENFEEYLHLAQSLLMALLNVSQDSERMPLSVSGDDLLFNYFSPTMRREREYYDFQRDVAIAIAIFRPNYATRSFEKSLQKLGKEVDSLNSIDPLSSIYETVKADLIEKFNKLTGQKIKNIEFILEACFDVTYLQLAVLLSNLQEDHSKGLEIYKKFRDYSRRDIPKTFDEVSQEDIDIVDSFSNWVYRTRDKINTWTESTVPKF